ncbi:uncharacterized protein CCOS01_01009 [Colletotrichum costaricense]|uniref:Uncharacterized protein n=1 Tax=Colletotrichum costaricense TaxID=1209916 RepID=A0AAI9ZC53_9PEZI|nr:uncharacterized protein CCOS01_01009 [Colletotrichum costaricense]KAK1539695.1 hypothetical protein CCOS01_01009 [Colletotrichum costaricense]
MMGQGWGRPAKARSRFKVKVASSRVGVESSSKLMSQRDVPPAGPLTCAFFSGSGKGKVTGEERAIWRRYGEGKGREGGTQDAGRRNSRTQAVVDPDLQTGRLGAEEEEEEEKKEDKVVDEGPGRGAALKRFDKSKRAQFRIPGPGPFVAVAVV